MSEEKSNFDLPKENTQLLALYSAVIKEMHSREIIKSKRVTGDLGEYYALQIYNNTKGLAKLGKTQTGTKDYDATDRQGKRYSIKAISGKASSPFYGIPKDRLDEIKAQPKFDFLILVSFTDIFELGSVYELTWGEVIPRLRWRDSIKAFQLPFSKELMRNTRKSFQLSDFAISKYLIIKYHTKHHPF